MMRDKPLRQIVAGEQAKLIQAIRCALSYQSVPASSKIRRIEDMIAKHDTEVKVIIEQWFIKQEENAKKEVTKQ